MDKKKIIIFGSVSIAIILISIIIIIAVTCGSSGGNNNGGNNKITKPASYIDGYDFSDGVAWVEGNDWIGDVLIRQQKLNCN